MACSKTKRRIKVLRKRAEAGRDLSFQVKTFARGFPVLIRKSLTLTFIDFMNFHLKKLKNNFSRVVNKKNLRKNFQANKYYQDFNAVQISNNESYQSEDSMDSEIIFETKESEMVEESFEKSESGSETESNEHSEEDTEDSSETSEENSSDVTSGESFSISEEEGYSLHLHFSRLSLRIN